MKKLNLFLILQGISLLSMAFAALAEPYPDTLWTRTFGGTGYDKARDAQQTVDGGYIIAGKTSSFGAGELDFWIVKTDSIGDTLWTRTFGGGSSGALAVQETADGGYIVAGWTMSYGAGDEDFYLVKIDSMGDTLWTRTYGGIMWDEAWDVRQTIDGGYIVTGLTKSYGAGEGDFYLVKTDSAGDTLWTRTYGGSLWDAARAVQQTLDGGYIIAGETESFGADGNDIYLVKTNTIGDTLWTHMYGGSIRDRAQAVQQTMDGGYIIAGDSGWKFYLMKIDSMGDTLWTRRYGGSGDDQAWAVEQTIDMGYIAAGWTSSIGAGGLDVYLVKTNLAGDTLWTRTYGGSQDDAARAVHQTTNMEYFIAGWTGSFGVDGYDFYVVKTGPERGLYVFSPNGSEQWRILQYDTVRWYGYGFEGGLKIELNRDYPGGVWEVLVDGTENDGEEPIFVMGPLSDGCRVAVSTLDGAFSDTSDRNFSITSSQGYLALVRPAEPGIEVPDWNAGIIECRSDTISETLRWKNFGSETIDIFAPESLVVSEHFYSENDCDYNFGLAPGEISACTLAIIYTPQSEGVHLDTLLIQTNAINAVNGYVRIPLSGEQIRTPDTVEVVISIEGGDARLSWDSVKVSIYGCPIDVTHYLVFDSPTYEGPYYYHGYSADTTYVHYGVAHYEYGMFYNVTATTAPLPLLQSLPTDAGLTREKVLGMLKEY